MSSSASRVRDAYIELQRKKLYQIVLCDTTDIRQIADCSNMSYEKTIEELDAIIKLSDRSKKWYAFKGSYIDRGEGRMILAVPPDELVVFEPGGSSILRVLYIVLIVAFVICAIIAAFLNAFFGHSSFLYIIILFIALPVYMFSLNLWKDARFRNYIRLISEKKLTALADIARSVKKPIAYVEKDFQHLIDNQILINARINQKTNELIILSSQSPSGKQRDLDQNNLKVRGVTEFEVAIDSYNDPDKLQRLYQMVIRDTTDIRQIASRSKMSYEETVGLLEHIIADSNSKSWYNFPKDWHACKGAYIDYQEKRIVLDVAPNALITANTGMKHFWIIRIAGYFLGLAGLIFPFIFKPEWSPKSDLKSVIIGCLLITVLSAGLVLLSHFDVLNTIGGNRIKRLRRYIRLISDEKMTSITDLAHAVKKPVEFVRKDLQKNIDRYLIVNARIDLKTDRILIVSSKNKSVSD